MKFGFLAYIPDTFGLNLHSLHLLSPNGEKTDLNILELHKVDFPIVTFDNTKLIDTFKKAGANLPNNIIFVEDALKLSIGLSKDDGGEKEYSFWNYFSKSFETSIDAENYENTFKSKVELTDKDFSAKLLTAAVIALKDCWSRVSSLLKSNGEFERFFEVEVPCRQIFNYRQYEGIKIKPNLIDNLLDEVRKEKYTSFQAVANFIKRSPSDLNFWNIKNYLSLTDASHLSDIEEGGILKEAFKIAQKESTFAKHFLQFIDSKLDEKILIRSATQQTTIYPIFDTNGTITSRITISDPFIQNLRKKYRSLFSAKEGKKLAYLDFSQFEPGILASLSKDASLIDLYNTGDIYESLSQSLFNTADQRTVCKRIFLGFIYGMSVERISKVLCSPNTSQDKIAEMNTIIQKFFYQFNKLLEFRAEKKQELEKQSYVQSLFGNKRHRKTKNQLTSKETRWALNHTIQATASLIFKEALIKLVEKFGIDCVLIPMHDAILMQVDDDEHFEDSINTAKKIMINAFNARCSGINGRVTISLTF